MPTVQRESRRQLGGKAGPPGITTPWTPGSSHHRNACIQLQPQDQMFTCVCPLSKNMLSE